MKFLLILYFTFGILNSTFTQLTIRQKQALDALFDGFNGRNPGIAVSIVCKDSLIYETYGGFSNIGKNEEITAKTRFNVASISKQIVALKFLETYNLSILKPEHSRSIKLGDLSKEYPQWSTIPIIDFINHSSGLREFHTINSLKGKNQKKTLQVKVVDQYLNDFKQLSYAHGTKHTYSNSNYYVLYQMLQSKESTIDVWDTYLKSKGLNETFWQDGRTCKNCANGHLFMNNKFKQISDQEMLGGYSNLWTSAQDFQIWMMSLLKNSSILQKLSKPHQLTTGKEVPYQCGFIQDSYKQVSTLEHGGNTRGFRSYMCLIPEKDLGIAIFVNTDYLNPLDYVRKIQDIFNHEIDNSATEPLQGQIVDVNKAPLPYAEIYINSTSGPTLTTDTGYFNYRVEDWIDTITFAQQNYEMRIERLENLQPPKRLRLKRKHSIENLEGTVSLIRDNRHESYALGPWSSLSGVTMVNRFNFVESISIETVSVFIKKSGTSNAPFRIVMYGSNAQNWPNQKPMYTSQPIHGDKGNEWVEFKLDKPFNSSEQCIFVGIQYLSSNGNKGTEAPHLAFDKDKNTNISYFRMPFESWNRVGALTYRGNRDFFIKVNGTESSGVSPISQTVFHLYDSIYHRILPCVLDGDILFIEPYPKSREIRFDKIGINIWKHPRTNWQFTATFNANGEYVLSETESGRASHAYEYLLGSYDSQNYMKGKYKVKCVEGDLKWRLKLQDDYLKIRIAPWRYMRFERFKKDMYFLPGDASFGRFIELKRNAIGQIIGLYYHDNRNHNITFLK